MERENQHKTSLVAFIETAKAKGASDEFLVKLLERRGWPEEEIYEALNSVYERLTSQPTPSPAQAARGESRDVFIWLLELLALGIWTTALGSIIFDYIDRSFPDSSRYRPGAAIALYNIAYQIACILVALPTQLIVARIMARDLRRYPEKLISQTRKKIIYAALFIVAFIAIGDLIFFLASFLRSELTVRFVLQSITVFIIAGGIFLYEMSSLGRGKEAHLHVAKSPQA